jgi:hypothetical protein
MRTMVDAKAQVRHLPEYQQAEVNMIKRRSKVVNMIDISLTWKRDGKDFVQDVTVEEDGYIKVSSGDFEGLLQIRSAEDALWLERMVTEGKIDGVYDDEPSEWDFEVYWTGDVDRLEKRLAAEHKDSLDAVSEDEDGD